jgi:nucleoside-diphosphate-sugar epimerase
MKVLFTGATGYVGKGMTTVLAAHHHLRGVDIRAAPTACQELMIADITDLAACRRSVEGMEAIVMCHMAPNPDGYKNPPLAFDVNVKGTANLYHAAVEHGVRRVVLISSMGTVLKKPVPARDALPGVGPYAYGTGLYVLTKVIQEGIACHYFTEHQLPTAILRPMWIVNDDDLVTKYGYKLEKYDPSLIDPRDIGRAALAALALPDPCLEHFNLGQDDYDRQHDMAGTRLRLGWRPEHRFASLARP